MKQKVIKAGHSMAIVIPAKLTRIMGIKPGNIVGLKAQPEKGKIILSFSGTQQLPLIISRQNLP